MGVPKFFRWLSERYPKVNQRLGRVPVESTVREHYGTDTPHGDHALPAEPDPLSTCSSMPAIDRLYLDMNGIIHGCSHNNNNDSEDDSETVSQVSEAQIFQNVCYYLDRVVKDVVQPTSLVYMAIDGVAPRAKLNQQRARRYRSGKEGEIEKTVYDAHLKKVADLEAEAAARIVMEEEEEDGFADVEKDDPGDERPGNLLFEEVNGGERDPKEKRVDPKGASIQEIEPGRFAGKFLAHLDTVVEEPTQAVSVADQDLFHSNNITPGTPFFTRCTAHIEHFLKKKISEDPAWQKLTVVFSGSSVPGEGEHKIMNFMREQKTAYEQNAHQKRNKNNNTDHPTAYHPNLRHCIMGQDGDLIMLGLLSHEPNLVLLREKVLFDARRRMEQQSTANALARYVHNPNFELLHMNVLRDYFAYEFETSNVLPDSKWDLEHCIDDFVFLTFFVGNDFLPHMPLLDIADEAFDLLFYTYRELRTRWLQDDKSGLKPYLTDAGSIVSGQRLEEFLQVLGKHETPYLEHKKQTDDVGQNRELEAKYGQNTIPSDEVIAAKEESDRALFRERIERKMQNDHPNAAGKPNQLYADFEPVLTSSLATRNRTRNDKQAADVQRNADDEQEAAAMQERMGGLLRHTLESGKDVHIDDQDLKGRYYSDKFGFGPFDAEKHVALRKSYLEGLVWNLKYYYEGCASWEWFYPYHYGPMLSDLRGIEGMLEEIKFEMGKPLKPFEQLMACMPPSHADVLPQPYRALMTDPASPIADFYPQSFTIDMNGKRWPWEAVVLLPFIDSQRLLSAAGTIEEHQLTQEERLRNERGEAMVFSHDPMSAHQLDAVGQGAVFSAVEKCTASSVPLGLTSLNYETTSGVSPLFRPKLLKGVQVPLPGFPTLRDGSVQGLWRKLLRVNVHGSRSRYKTACLEIDNPLPEVLPAETIAQHLNGTTIWINYPHFIEALVTAVSDSEGYIRGNAARKLWNREDAAERKTRINRITGEFVFGEKMVGTGGIALLGGDDAMDDLDILLSVRPFSGLKTMPDGTVVKTFAKFEVEVPLFVTGWVPHKLDERLVDLPVRLEKDPYNAATTVITDRRPPKQSENTPNPKQRFLGRMPNARQRLQTARGYHTLPASSSANKSTKSVVLSTALDDWLIGFASIKEKSLHPRGSVAVADSALSSQGQLFRHTIQRDLGSTLLASQPQSMPKRHIGASTVAYTNTFRHSARNARGGILAVGLLTFASFFYGSGAVEFVDRVESRQLHSVFGSGGANPLRTTPANERRVAETEVLPFDSKRPTPPIEFAHGTTTLSFVFQGGIVAAVDSRASMGSFVGSKTTQKVLPINSHVLGTMAGGAADCSFWIRKLKCEAAVYELNEGRRMPVAQCSRILSNFLYENRAFDLSVGTMIMGFDDMTSSGTESRPKIFYVDNSGMRIEGDLFAVGSGSTLALGILDTERRYNMSAEEAVSLGIKAIRHSTFRDAYSGGFINVYLITSRDGWKRVFTEDLDQLAASEVADGQDN